MRRLPTFTLHVLALTFFCTATHAQPATPKARLSTVVPTPAVTTPLPAPPAPTERAMLRVACDDTSVNAEITINGEFKGECPVDIQVQAGQIKLRALKKVDVSSDRVFEQDFRMAADTVKRVTIELGPPQLNAQGRKLQEEQLKQQEALGAQRATEERLLALEKEQRDAEARETTRRAESALQAALESRAAAGDTDAMLALAERLNVNASAGAPTAAALDWYRKAAANGSPYAQFLLSDLYLKNMTDSGAQALLKILKRPTSNERTVSVTGPEAVRQFVATDAFFHATGAGTSSDRRKPNEWVTHDRTCKGNGRNFAFEGNINIKNHNIGSRDHSVTGTAALGGLFLLNWKSSRLFESAEVVATAIDKVSGQPLPLDETSRFGISFKTAFNGDYVRSVALACGADPTRKSSLPNTKLLACLVSSNGNPVGYVTVHMNMNTGCAWPGTDKGDITVLPF